MQTQLIRYRRGRIQATAAALALFVPLFLILFFQHGETQAQGEDLTATETETAAFFGTETDTPTDLETVSDTPTNADTSTDTPAYVETSTDTPSVTLFPLVSPTDTETGTLTPTETETPTPTETEGFISSHITNQIILRYKSGSQAAASPKREDQIQRLNDAAGVKMEHRRTMSGGAQVYHFQGKHTEKEIQAIADKLKKLPEVEYAEPDWLMFPTEERRNTLPVLESRPLFFIPNDPMYSYQWHYFEAWGINAEAAWNITTGSTSVTVAVIDTGITSHAEFAGRIVPGYDFIDDALVANDGDGRDGDPSDPGDWITAEESASGYFAGCYVSDSSWHGTHTAGTIGASGNNNLGVAGIDWQAKILPVRVLGKCGGYTSDIVDGMRWAAGLTVAGAPANANPAKVLSISLGGYHACGTTTQNAINEITAAGSVVVVAAGNSNMDASGFGPANCNGVITVAATNRSGYKAYYSNYGATVEISAPGGDTSSSSSNGVLSTLNTGTQGPVADTYGFYQGTSMAAPHVSGVVSLLFSIDPSLTPAEVLTILQSTAKPFPAGGTCTTANCGAGIVNAGAALASLLPTPTPTETATGTLPTPTETGTPTITPTPSQTNTPSRTRTITPTRSITPTPTVTPTRTQTGTPTNTQSAAIVVVNTNDNGPGSLRQAVADIASGGLITFDPSLAGQTITLASTISILRPMTIDGSGLSARIEISGNNAVRIFLVDISGQLILKSLVLKNGYMSATSYTNWGGGMYLDGGQVTIQDSVLKNNSAYEAGAINVRPDVQLTIWNTEFSYNISQANAGAIRSYYATMTIRNSAFTANTAGSGGGAIYLDSVGTYVIEDSVFTANHANSGGAFYIVMGGVLDITLRRNLFSENVAASVGGALVYTSSGSYKPLLVENNTFYANQAGQGGAVYAGTAGIAIIRNNTFSANYASSAGASLYLYVSNATLYNNIMADSTAGGECAGYGSYYTAGSNNLVEDGSAACMPSLTGDPLLGPLADNGGPTLTLMLQAGSPAIDAGDDANCPSTDQRGYARPMGAHCDLGAVESESGASIPTNTHTPTRTLTRTLTRTPVTPTMTRTRTYTPTLTSTRTSTSTTSVTPPTPTYTRTRTNTPTVTRTPTRTPTPTLSVTPTPTITETPPTGMVQPTHTFTPVSPTLTPSDTDTPFLATNTYTPVTVTSTFTLTDTPGITPIPPTVGSCPSIPFPTEDPQPGARGLFPYGIYVDYFNDVAPLYYLLDAPINWATLTSPVNYSEVVEKIDYAWNGASPAPGVQGYYWSACYQGYLQVPQDGAYTFYLDNLDDGGMLYVGDMGSPIIASWLVQGPHFYQQEITLTAGITPIRLIYAQGPGSQGSVTLAWSSAGFAKEVIPAAGINPATWTPSRTPRTPTSTKTWTPSETSVPPIVVVSVLDTNENPEVGITVQAFVGSTNTGFSAKTDATGHATLTLPEGSYRFRVVKNGTSFWSGTTDHCAVPGCTDASIITTIPVTIMVLNLDGQPESGISVLAYDGTTYTGYSAYTNAQGQVSFTLPMGSYRFRAAKNNRFFWSGGSNHCAVPGCTTAIITVDNTVIVTVLDTDGNPEAGLNVLVYNGSTYAGYAAYTNAQGQAAIALPAGSYRFRVAKGGTAFWSGTANHCTVPGCTSASITTTVPVTVTVLDLAGDPQPGLTVQVYSGSTYFGYTATTNAQGQVSYTLPAGSYRFRTYKNSRTFWSGAENHCTIPGCTASVITTDSTVTVTVLDAGGNPETGINVQAFNGSTFAGYSLYTNAQGQAALALPAGNYRFRVVKGGTAFWSGPANHCTVPGCTSAGITTSVTVTITVINLDGQPEAGISVIAYTGTTYAGYSGTTNTQGQVSFTMPDGSYRFRATKGNRFFWSGVENHCTVPGCTSATITVDNTVVVTVLDTSGNPEAGLNVLAYNGTTYAGYAAYTNAQGQAALALPAGSYRFRVAKGGTAFWSGPSNHCTVPGCTSVSITTTIPVVVTVLDAGSNPEPGLTVQAYNGSTYAGYSAVSNAQGQVSFTLPVGGYRFRTIKGSDIYWSGDFNHCTVPGCTSAGITTDGGALAASLSGAARAGGWMVFLHWAMIFPSFDIPMKV